LLCQQISIKMRKSVATILGVLLIVVGLLVAKEIANSKKTSKPTNQKVIKTVFTEQVTNKEIPILINTGGTLQAKDRIDIYSEVQGIMIEGNTAFKTGNKFRKGEILMQINSDEYEASLLAQKSNFFTLLSGIMPDLQLDYSTYYPVWKTYLESINLKTELPKLPTHSDDKLKYFLSAKNILSSYHQVKNMEVRLAKYSLSAPFDGILTESNLNPGSLIRNGQKLGEFIKLDDFELELAVPASFAPFLKIGQAVKLNNKEADPVLYGTLVRINGKVEQSSQMLKIYVQLNETNLREGLYMEAEIQGSMETNVIEIPRALLIGDDQVFTIKEDRLQLTKIVPVYHSENTVIIRGLQDGQRLMNKVLPGAFNGMEVKTINN